MSFYQLLLTDLPLQCGESSFASEEGAECQFLGVVRDLENGQLISGIEYTAYHSMAEKELEKICAEAEKEHGTHRVDIRHRLGFVAAAEPSILIRVKTKHSAAAFNICHWYLKQIKTSVPIWKNPVWHSTENA